MSDFKLCKNGHYYQNFLEECPYCPKPSQSPSSTAGNLDKTKIFIQTSDIDPTKIEDFADQPFDQTKIVEQAADLTKTRIIPSTEGEDRAFNKYVPQASNRKLVGWLVSFTINANGADFRLYEGRNSVGSEPGCDIVVPNDPSVSAKHLTILNRMGGFKYKDELSTNGTFVNDEFSEEGSLQDGDIIKIGHTIFKFRTVG